MESLSRHRKKLPNANANNNGRYDGVFVGGGGGAARFGGGAQPSRIEDYGEIFGSRGTSIPILDVSALGGEARVSRSKLDYSAIFRGFGDGGDIGASYEEVFAKPNGARTFSVGARYNKKKKRRFFLFFFFFPSCYAMMSSLNFSLCM